jgi:uncharacterized protein YjbI with pentapeptide repeats
MGANLEGANLEGADLKGAILWDAILWDAILWGANLMGANLKGANLEGADLKGADLMGAILWDAILWGANLMGANLKGADLKGANLTGTILEKNEEPQDNTSFSQKVKELEEISQEFDEKIDDLLVKTQRKFAVSKETAEHFYNHKFNKIIENFEHAKKYGSFPLKLTLDYSKLTATGSNITSTFVIKQGNKHEGYYTFGSGYFRYYMNKKPNWLVRNCAKIFFDFTWKDV